MLSFLYDLSLLVAAVFIGSILVDMFRKRKM